MKKPEDDDDFKMNEFFMKKNYHNQDGGKIFQHLQKMSIYFN